MFTLLEYSLTLLDPFLLYMLEAFSCNRRDIVDRLFLMQIYCPVIALFAPTTSTDNERPCDDDVARSRLLNAVFKALDDGSNLNNALISSAW
jgi:hypothetical protein